MAVDALVQPSPGHLIWLVLRRASCLSRAATGAATLERIVGFLFVAVAVEFVLTACSIIVPGLR